MRGTAQPLGGGRWQGLQRLRLPSHTLGSCPTADWSRGARAFHPCCLLDGIAKPDQGLSPGPRRVLGGGSTVARPQRPPQETELLLFVCLARAGPGNHRPLQMYAAEKGCSPGLEIAPSPTLFQSSLYSLSGFSNKLPVSNEKESGLKQVHTLDVQLPLLSPKQQFVCRRGEWGGKRKGPCTTALTKPASTFTDCL